MISDVVHLENRRLNQLEIEQGKTILASKVRSLVVTLTTRCNISCIMCEEQLIPWDISKEVLHEIVSLFPYLEEIIWQGGETLLLSYFQELLDEAAKFTDLHQSIITNGLPITEDLARKLVRENMELTFSIDAVTNGLYEFIRRKAEFERLLENTKLINSIRKERNFKNFSFRMHVVIMKSNYRELGRFIDFAKEYGFDALHLMPIWGNINSDENIFYHKDPEALKFINENIGETEKKAKGYNINLLNSLPSSFRDFREGEHKEKLTDAETQNGKAFCYMPWKRMVINPAGNICPACHCKEMVGNVSKESLNEIWNNEKMQMYRQKLASKDYWDLCNSDCIRGIISEELRGLR